MVAGAGLHINTGITYCRHLQPSDCNGDGRIHGGEVLLKVVDQSLFTSHDVVAATVFSLVATLHSLSFQGWVLRCLDLIEPTQLQTSPYIYRY